MTVRRTARTTHTTHVFVGPADHAHTLLRSATGAGRLLYATAPSPVPGTPGHVRVVYRLRTTPTTAPAGPDPTVFLGNRRARTRTALLLTLAGLGIAGVAFTAGYATRHLTTTAIGGALMTFTLTRLAVTAIRHRLTGGHTTNRTSGTNRQRRPVPVDHLVTAA